MKTKNTAKGKKQYVKEDEDEAMRMKEAEAEDKKSKVKKKPTEEDENGNLRKEDEDESEEGIKKEDEDESEDRMRKEEEDEEEDEDEDNEEKGALGGENPEELVITSQTEGHTTTTRPVINTRQNVFNPKTQVSTGRNSTSGTAQMGQSPSEVSYSGKSVNPDLLKSPLFVELNKSIEGMNASVAKKLNAVEKSVNDRIANLQKTVAKLEEFYASPFYKSIETENQTIQKSADTMSQRLEKGNVRFTD